MGEKHFTLLPPSDVLFLYEQDFPQGRYRQRIEARDNKDLAAVGGGEGGRANNGKGNFEVEMEEGDVPWIPVGECVARAYAMMMSRCVV